MSVQGKTNVMIRKKPVGPNFRIMTLVDDRIRRKPVDGRTTISRDFSNSTAQKLFFDNKLRTTAGSCSSKAGNDPRPSWLMGRPPPRGRRKREVLLLLMLVCGFWKKLE